MTCLSSELRKGSDPFQGQIWVGDRTLGGFRQPIQVRPLLALLWLLLHHPNRNHQRDRHVNPRPALALTSRWPPRGVFFTIAALMCRSSTGSPSCASTSSMTASYSACVAGHMCWSVCGHWHRAALSHPCGHEDSPTVADFDFGIRSDGRVRIGELTWRRLDGFRRAWAGARRQPQRRAPNSPGLCACATHAACRFGPRCLRPPGAAHQLRRRARATLRLPEPAERQRCRFHASAGSLEESAEQSIEIQAHWGTGAQSRIASRSTAVRPRRSCPRSATGLLRSDPQSLSATRPHKRTRGDHHRQFR